MAGWSLLYGTLRTLASNIPVEALEMIARLGERERADGAAQKALTCALAAAEGIRDEEHRAEALVTVVGPLAEVGDQEVLVRALDATERIRDEGPVPRRWSPPPGQ